MSEPTIPRGWRVVQLGEVCQHNLGKMLDQKKNKGTLRPYLRNPNVQWFRFDLSDLQEMPFEAHELPKFRVEPGDVIICEGGEAGRAAIWSDQSRDVYIQKALHRVRPSSELLNRFLVYRLMRDSKNGRLSEYFTGTTIPHFTGQDLDRYTFALPPLSEQKRIAGILDQADSLRRKRQQALALTDQFLRSTFVDLFGDPATNPKCWPVSQLSDVVAPDRIVTYGIVQAGDHVSGGVPYIRTGDIVDGRIRVANLLCTSWEIAQSYKRSEVSTGDLVMSIRATVGTVAEVPPELDGANLTQGTARISPGSAVEKSYLLWAIRANGTQNWIQQQIKGATFKEITLGRLREMPVLVPPKSLQSHFANMVAAQNANEQRQADSLARADDLFNSIVQRAFRGEL